MSTLGTALTRAKCIADGMPVETINIRAVDCMTPSTHRQGIHWMVIWLSLEELKLIERECSLGSETLSTFLWSNALDGISDKDVSVEAYSAMADALHMFKDVQMAARLKVENATLRNEDGPGAN